MRNLFSILLVGCIGPTSTPSPTTPTGDTSSVTVETAETAETADTGSTPGLTAPAPGWLAAAGLAVVWHGRVHTHTGDDAVILQLDGEPLLIVGAPRPTDLGGPFPVVPEDVGPRVLRAPFAAGILQDVAAAGWMLPPDTDPYWTGDLGAWLEPAGDVRGTGVELVYLRGDLYTIPTTIVPYEDAKDSFTDMTAPRSCDLRGTGAVDLVSATGVALGPVPLPLTGPRYDTTWHDLKDSGGARPNHLVACGDFDHTDAGDEVALVTRSDGGALHVLSEVPPAGNPVIVSDIATATWTGPGPLHGVDHDRALVAHSDLDGDGQADIALGAPDVGLATSTGLVGGRAWVLTDPLLGGALDVGAHFILEPTYPGDRPGEHLTTGDFDGDGQHDLAVAYGTPSRVAVFRGPLPAGTHTDADADAVFYGQPTLDDGFGLGLAAGDLDGDGRDDLVIGAPMDDTEGKDGGAVYLLWGGGL